MLCELVTWACTVLLSWTSVIAAIAVYFGWSWWKGREFLAPKPPQPFSPVLPPIEGKGKVIECKNPATGEMICEDRAFTEEDVREAVARARKAQQKWSQASWAEKRAVLHDLMQYVVNNQEEICQLSARDTGKTLLEAHYGEVLTTCEKIRWLIHNAEKVLSPESRSPPLLLFLKKARVEYHPLGVIGIIIPWNYPVHNVMSAVVAALISGNGAVCKVSEWSTGSRRRIQEIFRTILIQRGHDPELVQVIAGYGDTGAALVRSGVDKVLFIGSPATGRKVMEAAAATLTPVVLELGGKDPFVVFDDAEFDHAVDVALRGVFTNCGQNCIAAERVFVQETIFDRFREAVVAKAKALRQGPSLAGGTYDCGAMTMPGQVDIVDNLVRDAVGQGAVVAAGGKRNARLPQGLFYEPTVLTGLRPDMRVVREEAFGPVMLLIPFRNELDLIELANATPYALGCSIFSTDYAKAERVGRAIVSGMTVINDFGLSYLIQALPFGGVKMSGFGRFNGPEGLREFSRIRSVVTDRFPLRTKAPKFVKYPVLDASPKFVHAAVSLIYACQWTTKLRGLFSLLSLALSNPK